MVGVGGMIPPAACLSLVLPRSHAMMLPSASLAFPPRPLTAFCFILTSPFLLTPRGPREYADQALSPVLPLWPPAQWGCKVPPHPARHLSVTSTAYDALSMHVGRALLQERAVLCTMSTYPLSLPDILSEPGTPHSWAMFQSVYLLSPLNRLP